MELKSYFETANGFGVLATANASGLVNAAVYSRPHVMDDGSIAIIMNDRATHENVKANPNALYLFHESGGGYRGKRLTLRMLREEQDTELLQELCHRCHPEEMGPKKPRFLVYFEVVDARPLIGSGE